MSVTGYQTAIARKRPSVPLRWLESHGLLRGRILDFGCGKGADMAYLISRGYSALGWDPHHRPARPRGKFATIVATYVFNVLPPAERWPAIADLMSYLADDGVAYLTVRADIVDESTTQYNVHFALECIRATSTYRTYVLRKLQSVNSYDCPNLASV